MSKILSIAKRELKSYFDSPIAYIVLIIYLLLTGFLFFGALFLIGRADLRDLFSPFHRTLFFTPAMLLILFAPAISMRLIAEEKKAGTLELITSMPITNAQLVLGKFLAVFSLTAIALLSTLIYAVCVAAMGSLDWGPVFSGYLGLLLYAAAVLSIGLLCSALTENQIIAFIVAAIVSAVLFFLPVFNFFVASPIASAADFISISSHLNNFARGVVDSRDVFYYLTLTGAALFIAERSLNRQRA